METAGIEVSGTSEEVGFQSSRVPEFQSFRVSEFQGFWVPE